MQWGHWPRCLIFGCRDYQGGLSSLFFQSGRLRREAGQGACDAPGDGRPRPSCMEPGTLRLRLCGRHCPASPGQHGLSDPVKLSQECKGDSLRFPGSCVGAGSPRNERWGCTRIQRTRGLCFSRFIYKENIPSKRHTWEYCYWKEHFPKEFL